MRARLLAGFLLFAFVVTISLELPLGLSMQSRQLADAFSVLRRDAFSLSVVLSDALAHDEAGRATEIASRYSRATGRQVVVTRGGRVFAASGAAARREAVDVALATALRTARSRTVSGETSNDDSAGAQFYVALPLQGKGDPAVRLPGNPVLLLALPASVVNDAIRDGWLKLGLFGLGALVAATALGLVISNSLIRPLRSIESAVDAIGVGSFDARAPSKDGPAELRRLAGAVNLTADRLIRLIEMQRTFVADASHQLRTPLTALRLRLENVQRADESPAALDLAAALAEVSRLSRLVEALLALARSEVEEPDLVPVNVTAVVNDRLEAWRPLAEEQHLEFDVSLKSRESTLVALACPEALEQVLDNLLANAFEATPQGGSVRIEAFQSEEFIELHVIDDGPGLAPAERTRAFDRFWRGRPSGHDGAGLGLAIVNQLVTASRGSSELREARGGGTDAAVRLPAASTSRHKVLRSQPTLVNDVSS